MVGGLLIYNAAVGFWQDYKASNALAALKKGLAPKARVLRDGTWLSIDAAELVPGDVVNVSAGQIVPADLLLIDGEYLSRRSGGADRRVAAGLQEGRRRRLFGRDRQAGRHDRRGHGDRQQHVLRPHRQARGRRRLGLAFAEGASSRSAIS